MRVLAVALIVLLAGCSGTTPEAPADTSDEPIALPRVPIGEWKEQLSQPIFDGVIETLHTITADDGTHLALTLYLPDGLPADAKIPTVLEITPYQTLDRGVDTAISPLSGGIEPAARWNDQVLRGMAFVRADARGGHSSGGCLDFGGPADRSDARLFMQWIRDQPWSDGSIATDGISHPGMGSVVAHVADPGLTAGIAAAPVVSYYMDEYYQGAHYDNQFNGPAYQAIELAPTTSTRPEDVAAQAAPCTGQTTTDYDLVDGTWHELWQSRDLALTLENELADGRTDVSPMLLLHGFNDLNVQPDHAQIYWDAMPDDAPKSMILGYWYHAYPDFDGHPVAAYSDFRQRFFDHHLLGIDNGMDREPRVLVEDSQGTWHESHDWPIDGSNRTTLWLTPEGLADAPGQEATLAYSDPTPESQDHPDARIILRSAPLEQDTLVNGAPSIDLVASSDQAETKFAVFVYDVAPDGRREHITHGMTDSHRRHDRDDGWTALTPGQATEFRIDLLPTAQVVEAGHHIEVEITSQWSNMLRNDVVCFDDHRGGSYCPIGILPSSTAGRATNTIHLGPEGTRIHMDLVDPSTTAKAMH